MITAAQSRSARTLLGWSVGKLASTASVSESTVDNFELERLPPDPATAKAIQRALEDPVIRAAAMMQPALPVYPRGEGPIPAPASSAPGGAAITTVGRPMQEALIVRRETHIPAPPAAVFALLTDPEKILRWMGTEAQVEPRPGGLYLVNVTGARFARGSFREVVPVHHLAYSFGWDGSEVVPPGSSLVEIDRMRANPLVCVEADEIVSRHNWQTVVIFGRYQELPDTPEFHRTRAVAHDLLAKTAMWWEPGYVETLHKGGERANIFSDFDQRDFRPSRPSRR